MGQLLAKRISSHSSWILGCRNRMTPEFQNLVSLNAFAVLSQGRHVIPQKDPIVPFVERRWDWGLCHVRGPGGSHAHRGGVQSGLRDDCRHCSRTGGRAVIGRAVGGRGSKRAPQADAPKTESGSRTMIPSRGFGLLPGATMMNAIVVKIP